MDSTDTHPRLQATATAPATPRPSSQGHLLLIAGKCAISALLIGWLLHDIDLGAILSVMQSSSVSLLVLAFLLCFVIYIIGAYRWRLLLRAQGADPAISFLVTSYMAAAFFNTVLPSTIGGDVIRAFDSARTGIGKLRAIAVIVVDRIVGILALLLLAFCALLISRQVALTLPALSAWVLAGMVGTCAIALIVFAPPRALVQFVSPLSRSPLSRLRSVLRTVLQAFGAFKDQPGLLGQVLGLSLLLQATVILHYYLIAAALGFGVPFREFFLIVPLAICVTMLPITISGIGLREHIFVFLFAAFSISRPEAIAFAWLVYGMVILHGLLGGIVYALRKQPVL